MSKVLNSAVRMFVHVGKTFEVRPRFSHSDLLCGIVCLSRSSVARNSCREREHYVPSVLFLPCTMLQISFNAVIL